MAGVREVAADRLPKSRGGGQASARQARKNASRAPEQDAQCPCPRAAKVLRLVS